MFGRIFGRGKDEPEAAVCAMCGRTLLAGEWTRKVTGAHGEERLVCSLCGPDLPLDDRDLDAAVAVVEPVSPAEPDVSVDEAVEYEPPPPERADAPSKLAVAGAAHLTPATDLGELERRVALVEARYEELASELERMRLAVVAGQGSGDASAEQLEEEQPIDSSEPGERTWGETPAEFAALLEASAPEMEADALPESDEPSEDASATPVSADESAADAAEVAADLGEVVEPALVEEEQTPAPHAEEPPTEAIAEETGGAELEAGPSADLTPEDTQPIPALEADALVGEAQVEAADEERLAAPEGPDEVTAEAQAVGVDEGAEAPPAAVIGEAEVAALALLQRGVDLFNVSGVPRRIAETNEQLGTPEVHAEPLDDTTVTVTFMWSMGWYRFHVDTDTGDVDMNERGYEEIKDVASNAGVRADGTIHLAPAQISAAAAQRVQHGDVARTSERDLGAPETPRTAAQKAPEILSKSLLGQRSDDEPADWEKTRARDFDWEH